MARKAIAAHPNLFSEAPNTHADGRVHIHVASNAEGHFSILPYSVRAQSGRVAMPVSWDELQTVDMHGTTLQDFPSRLAAKGEVFGAMLHRVAAGSIESHDVQILTAGHVAEKGSIPAIVIDVLSDGRTLSAKEILEAAHARGELLNIKDASDLGTNIEAFIGRDVANGRRPSIVWTVDHKFRINEPEDPWPDGAQQPPASSADVNAVVAQLQTAVHDSAHPENFEIAVCDALAALGFLATHVGGKRAPDGFADAPLGRLGYRVMIECKSGTAMQKGPDVFEASKYRDAYRAQYCALVGITGGSAQKEAVSEAKTHGVSLWGVEDLVCALQHGFSPAELAPAFGPGVIAQEALMDILWARNHGVKKRVSMIAGILRDTGWTTQCGAAASNTPADAPLITEDAAMLLVDQTLAAQGAHVNCSRDEVRLAFEWLTSPLSGAAVWTPDKTGIVITQRV